MELVNRRQVTVALALALLGGAAVAAGCGSTPTSPAGPPSPAGIVGTVDSNHPAPHVAIITAAQLSAGVGVTIDISNGLHSHSAAFTAAQVGQIAAGGRVSVASSTNPHSDGSGPHQHQVTFN